MVPWITSSNHHNVSGIRLHWPFRYFTMNSKLCSIIAHLVRWDEGRGWLKTQIRAEWSVSTSKRRPSKYSHHFSTRTPFFLYCRICLFSSVQKSRSICYDTFSLLWLLSKDSSKPDVTSISLHLKVTIEIRGSQHRGLLKSFFQGFKSSLTLCGLFPSSLFLL